MPLCAYLAAVYGAFGNRPGQKVLLVDNAADQTADKKSNAAQYFVTGKCPANKWTDALYKFGDPPGLREEVSLFLRLAVGHCLRLPRSGWRQLRS